VIRAVLLDAHGTLVALEPPAPRLRRLLRERFGVVVGAGEAERAMRAEIAYYRRHLGEAADEAGVQALRGRCAEVLRAQLPQSRALAEVNREAMTGALVDALVFKAFPDAAPALSALREAGLRLVVASNWDASLPAVLASTGLVDLVDGVVTSALSGASKPAPAVFRAALRLAGVAPAEALAVGDRLDEDVAGARAAGVEPILLVRGDAGDAPVRAPCGAPGPGGLRLIRSLAELPRLVAERSPGLP